MSQLGATPPGVTQMSQLGPATPPGVTQMSQLDPATPPGVTLDVTTWPSYPTRCNIRCHNLAQLPHQV